MTLPVLCFAQVAVSTLTGLGGRGPGRASAPSPPAWVAPAEGEGRRQRPRRPHSMPSTSGSWIDSWRRCRMPSASVTLSQRQFLNRKRDHFSSSPQWRQRRWPHPVAQSRAGGTCHHRACVSLGRNPRRHRDSQRWSGPAGVVCGLSPHPH